MILRQRKAKRRRLERREDVAFNNAVVRFFQLMAATAQTKEARAVYLSFLTEERKLLSEHALAPGSK
jgi:hypothetical protein